MSEQPPAGWYPDSTGTSRWWDGDQWTDHVQTSSAPPVASPPPGWHSDPNGGNNLRFWDGRQWTVHTAPQASAAAPVQQPSSEAKAYPTSMATDPGSPQSASGDAIVSWIKNHPGLSGLVAVVALLLVIGAIASPAEEQPSQDTTATTLVDDGEPTATAAPEKTEPPSPEPEPSPEPGDTLSKKQSTFIDVVEKAARKAESGNEIVVVNARKERGNQICALMPALKATEWVGEIQEVSTELGGDNGVVMLRLTDDIAAGTWNNSMSDIGSNTMIKPSSPLFDKLADFQEGDSVVFSGQFVRGPDCLEEQSLIDENGLLTPDFAFKFRSIKAL